MKITFIHHSAFLAELAGTALLFDYFEGALPEIPPGSRIVILASHAHGDHYNRRIFRIGADRPDTVWVLSDDIPGRDVPPELRERVYFVSPGETVTPGDGITVRAFRSTDQGVAFLVQVHDRVLYHAGDLNNWYWDGDAEDLALGEQYRAELLKIREALHGRLPDAAFVPLDPRLRDEKIGMAEYMELVGAKNVFPMHSWGDFAISDRFLADPVSGKWRDRFHGIHRDGEIIRIGEEA